MKVLTDTNMNELKTKLDALRAEQSTIPPTLYEAMIALADAFLAQQPAPVVSGPVIKDRFNCKHGHPLYVLPPCEKCSAEYAAGVAGTPPTKAAIEVPAGHAEISDEEFAALGSLTGKDLALKLERLANGYADAIGNHNFHYVVQAAMRVRRASSSPVQPTPITDIMRSELRGWLRTQVVNGDTIGGIRRSLFMPWDSGWNGIVRDETAKVEVSGGARLPASAGDTEGKANLTLGALADAKRRALNLFDEWNDVTGRFDKGTGYYYEIQSVIEDAVECGSQGACGMHEPLGHYACDLHAEGTAAASGVPATQLKADAAISNSASICASVPAVGREWWLVDWDEKCHEIEIYDTPINGGLHLREVTPRSLAAEEALKLLEIRESVPITVGDFNRAVNAILARAKS